MREGQGVGFYSVCPSSIPVTVTFGVCHAAFKGEGSQAAWPFCIDTLGCVYLETTFFYCPPMKAIMAFLHVCKNTLRTTGWISVKPSQSNQLINICYQLLSKWPSQLSDFSFTDIDLKLGVETLPQCILYSECYGRSRSIA